MNGSRSRRKGHDWERECGRILSDATGLDFSRVLTETRDGNSGDVTAEGSPFVVQAKAGKRPSVWRALREAKAATTDGKTPVAMVKRTHGRGKPAERVAVLDVEDFAALLHDAGEGG